MTVYIPIHGADMTPICVSCKCSMRCKKNDYVVRVGGKIWLADLYRCPKCDDGVVTGFGEKPVSSAGDRDFYTWMAEADLEVE